MNIKILFKYLTILTVTLLLGFAEGTLTNPPASQHDLEYQEYYKQATNNAPLSQKEFNELEVKEWEYMDNLMTPEQTKYLLNAKLSFALAFLIVAFINFKYLLKGTKFIHVAYSNLIYLVALFWFVSTFELIIYMACCIIGTLVAKKYNKSLSRIGADAAPPG